LLDYPNDDVEDVFCLNFSVATEHFGCVTTHPLLPNGEEVAVTKANRQELRRKKVVLFVSRFFVRYVDLYTRFLLLDSVSASLKAFIGGFSLLANREGFLQHVLPQELERIVCGYPHWNLAELQRVTTYEGGFSAETPVVIWFWEIVAAMSTAEQHKLLSFATGSDRVPVGGFSEMEFVIQRQGSDSEVNKRGEMLFFFNLQKKIGASDESHVLQRFAPSRIQFKGEAAAKARVCNSAN
jgi:hypothetical protein